MGLDWPPLTSAASRGEACVRVCVSGGVGRQEARRGPQRRPARPGLQRVLAGSLARAEQPSPVARAHEAGRLKPLGAPGAPARCLRPYQPERARSRLISEAKQGRAWLVLGWETAWEYRVL